MREKEGRNSKQDERRRGQSWLHYTGFFFSFNDFGYGKKGRRVSAEEDNNCFKVFTGSIEIKIYQNSKSVER